MFEFTGKTAIVTGSARGIGSAIAIALANAGANVVINYSSSEEAALQTQRLCGERSSTFRGDVSSEADCKALIDFAVERHAGIDILVNNAGIARDGLMLRMSPQDFDSVIAVNLRGAFLCSKHAARHMIQARRGRIVNIASVVGQAGNVGQANYVSSKAGLIGLTKACALELASRSVTVNAVAPGFVESDMTASLSEAVREGMLSRIPLGRFAQPADIVGAVMFLASDAASYITGQVIGVNGGMHV